MVPYQWSSCQSGVWPRVKETRISAAPWALWLGKNFTFSRCCNFLKKKHTLLTTSTFNLPFFRHDKNLKFFAFTAYRVYIGHIRIVAENTRLRPKRFFLSQKGLYYSLYFPYFCTNFAIDYRQIIQVLNHLEKWFIQIMHNK